MRRECRERFVLHQLQRKPLVSDPGMHHGVGILSESGHTRAVTHAGIANPRWRGKRSRHSRRMHNHQFYVSGKRPIEVLHEFSRLQTHISLNMHIMTQKLTCVYLLLLDALFNSIKAIAYGAGVGVTAYWTQGFVMIILFFVNFLIVYQFYWESHLAVAVLGSQTNFICYSEDWVSLITNHIPHWICT